jgi:hypothetical protein
VRNITSTLVEIPAIANVIAETINFCANTNLDKIFGELTDKILSVDVNEGNVINLFSSDQFLCGLFLQDSRFIIDDIKAPIIPIVAISSSVDIGTNFNFGRLLAVMAHTGEVDQTAYSNIFQTYNLRSSYSADSTNYETSGVSYHKGNILDDILPRATKNYDYAINDVTLLSTNNDYALSSNLDNNAHAILLALNSIYTPFNLNNYVSYTEIGHEYDFYGMGIGQYFICIGLCVGTLTQTMIYDKKKRFNKIKATK